MKMSVQSKGETRSEQIRPATKADAYDIASLFLMSSDGLASYIWSRVGAPGANLLEVGTSRYSRENTAFSYQNCHMVEIGGQVVAMLHGFKNYSWEIFST